MNRPPMLMHVRVHNDDTKFGFWLPLFLLIPLALVVLHSVAIDTDGHTRSLAARLGKAGSPVVMVILGTVLLHKGSESRCPESTSQRMCIGYRRIKLRRKTK